VVLFLKAPILYILVSLIITTQQYSDEQFNNNGESSSSSSCSNQGVGPLVDPFRSQASRSLLNGLPWFLLPSGAQFFYQCGQYVTWHSIYMLYPISLVGLHFVQNWDYI
jgi:hypothetical protein